MTDEQTSAHEDLFARLDAVAICEFRATPCPDQQQLLRYADQSLPDSARAEVREHLLRCTACACLVAQLQRISTPVLCLHQASFARLAWRHLIRGGALSPKEEQAWALHRSGCDHCRRSAERLTRLGLLNPAGDEAIYQERAVRAGWVSWRAAASPALSFALGVVLMFCLYPPTRIPNAPHGIPGNNPESGATLRAPGLPDLSTEGILQSLLAPVPDNPARQASQIQAWQALPMEMEMEKQSCLGGLYARIAAEEKDPARRRADRRASRESLLKARTAIDRMLQNSGAKSGNRNDK